MNKASLGMPRVAVAAIFACTSFALAAPAMAEEVATAQPDQVVAITVEESAATLSALEDGALAQSDTPESAVTEADADAGADADSILSEDSEDPTSSDEAAADPDLSTEESDTADDGTDGEGQDVSGEPAGDDGSEDDSDEQEILSGWVIGEDGTSRYYVDGVAVVGERRLTGADGVSGWYYFDSEGVMVSSADAWLTSSGGKWAYYDASGRMVYGEYYRSDDEAHTGWYHFDEVTGKMTHGWKYLSAGRKWVYYDPATGIMHHGEAKVTGSGGNGWCYFNDVTGATTYGWKYVQSNAGKWVYYDTKTGRMHYGEEKLTHNGETGLVYLQKGTGAAVIGWGKRASGTVAYFDENGIMQTGEVKAQDANGDYQWYYFLEDTGAPATGWKYLLSGHKWVYYDTTSYAMHHDTFKVDGVSYTANSVTGAVSNVSKILKAAGWMVEIAADDSHGYDQQYRWGERGDYDCSTLVISALRKAGLATGGATYTGNMRSALTSLGFRWITDLSQRRAGDILLNEIYHTAMYLGNETIVHAAGNEYQGAIGGKPGDQTGKEVYVRSYYVYSHGWDGILRYVG